MKKRKSNQPTDNKNSAVEKFWLNLDNLINHIEGLRKTASVVGLMEALANVEIKKVNEYIDKKGKKRKEINGVLYFEMDPEDQPAYNKLSEEADKSIIAIKILPISLFTSMISQFDIFVASLIRIVVDVQPKILSEAKQISFADANKFKNKKEIIDYFIEKEIDSVLYSDHLGHIEWLGDKTGIDFKSHIKDILPYFIEITERRNLFVHSDGMVTSKYIEKCKKAGFQLNKKIKKGTQLSVPPSYFKSSDECLYEISVKITFLLWEKFYPNTQEAKDDLNLRFTNNVIIKLVEQRKYDLADKLLVFALDNIRTSVNEETSRIWTINRALCNKLKGDMKQAQEIIKKKDWSACSDEFKLAINIINGDIDSAIKLMRKIGSDSELIGKENYEADPIYIELRNSSVFKATFKEIFKKDYKSSEERRREGIAAMSPVISKSNALKGRRSSPKKLITKGK